jgi:hypothetical protein
MAALNFPANPVDGQLYPDPAIPGVTQYVYNSTKGTWLTVFRGVERVNGAAPIFISGDKTSPTVNIRPVTAQQSGYMTAADKQKLDSIDPTATGTVTQITAGTGLGAPNTGNTITTTGTLNLLPPTAIAIGGVRAGVNVDISTSGTISLKPPTPTVIGGVRAGSGVSISPDGVISASGGVTVLDNIGTRFNGVTTEFQLTVNNATFTPANPNNLLIFVGGIAQIRPAYTITGSRILFSAAPASGLTFYGLYFA